MLVETVESAPSTMDAARDRLLNGRVHISDSGRTAPAGIMAHWQTGGRGQQGRFWFSAPEESLAITLYMAAPEGCHLIPVAASLAVGVAAAKAIGALTTRTGCPIAQGELGLRWPNDIMLRGRKLAGILVERIALDRGAVALAGIGVNVNVSSFPDSLAGSAISLLSAGFTGISPAVLAMYLAEELEAWRRLLFSQGTAPIVAEWRTMDCCKNTPFTFLLDGAQARGTAAGIEDDGKLRLRLDDGRFVATVSATHVQACVGAA
ncbi:MAG: biotin--[acetyl-CoA-carboxylase] ligase [Armatimonadetes bacterium]|nr:biotin--[acetyl-CoA-carboxylase] ligase [Armatimonadota bacterium]MDE2205878.1 biotin--[acetyl-CoA-carboxylase] ligase [Armatimonadota bacterium]